MDPRATNKESHRVEKGSEEDDEKVDDAPEEVGYRAQAKWPRVDDPTVRGDVDHREVDGNRPLESRCRTRTQCFYFGRN